MKPPTRVEKFINSLESSERPVIYFILTFFFITTLRNFLEIFVYDPTSFSSKYFFHYYLSYIALALGFVILFYFATKEKIKKISKVILPFFSLLITPPIIDLIIGSYRVSYILPNYHGNLLLRFLTFGGSFTKFGITIGQKIEVLLILILSFGYFLIKNRSLIKSLVFSFLTYGLVFVYAISPFIVKAFLNFFGIEYTYSPQLMSNFYLLIIFILTPIAFYLHNKKGFISLLKDIPPLRALHFELMFILGIVLSGKNFLNLILNSENIFYFPFILISIFFAGLFSLIINNLEDYENDKISNRKNSIISKTISFKTYRKISLIPLIFAVVYSLSVNFQTFFIILLFIGNYFLYSVKPLRLKRIPILSKLIISINSLVLVMLGFVFSDKSLSSFPLSIAAFFLIFYTLAINFIDIKDYKGDKRAGIKTLPAILGLKRSKLIIGLFFLITYLFVPLVFKGFYIAILSPIFGAILFFLVNRRNYNERYVLSVYLLSVIILLLYLGL